MLRAYHACVGNVAGQHGGFVAKYLGDGVLIYFGYPQAHENDAERAVRAGLALVKGVAELTAAGEQLEARVDRSRGWRARRTPAPSRLPETQRLLRTCSGLRVIREGRAESRFEALHGTQVTELVGRDEELDLCCRAGGR